MRPSSSTRAVNNRPPRPSGSPAACATAPPAPPAAEPPLGREILPDDYQEDAGALHVRGELKNPSDPPAAATSPFSRSAEWGGGSAQR
jgi:hypothetical protein